MLFTLPDNDGNPVFGGGSYTDDGCETKELNQGDFTISSTGTWSTSSDVNCIYPMGWRVTVEGMTLTIAAALEKQELALPYTTPYWEGAAVVSGDAAGRAYVEMTGYCQ